MKKILGSTAATIALAATLFGGTASADYEVKSGDTLGEIASKYGTTVNKLSQMNPQISNINLIYPGQSIKGIGSGYSPTTQYQPKYQPKQQSQTRQSVKQTNNSSYSTPSGRTITVTATAYGPDCTGCTGKTAIGLDARSGQKIIAVDPRIIPLGSKVYVEGYGYAIAGDTGGAIKGNRIDVLFPSEAAAKSYGVQQVNVTILN